MKISCYQSPKKWFMIKTNQKLTLRITVQFFLILFYPIDEGQTDILHPTKLLFQNNQRANYLKIQLKYIFTPMVKHSSYVPT